MRPRYKVGVHGPAERGSRGREGRGGPSDERSAAVSRVGMDGESPARARISSAPVSREAAVARQTRARDGTRGMSIRDILNSDDDDDDGGDDVRDAVRARVKPGAANDLMPRGKASVRSSGGQLLAGRNDGVTAEDAEAAEILVRISVGSW